MNNALRFTSQGSIFFLLIVTCFFLSAIPIVSASVVEDIEIYGLYGMDKNEMLYLLNIIPGETIDEVRLREGIKRAFLKGVFEDISVEATEGEKIRVKIHVKQKAFIKKISLQGTYDLPKKTILSLFPLKKDQYLSCDMLEKAVDNLKHELALRGYPHVQVETSIQQLGGPYEVALLLHIVTGRPEKIDKIIISGATDDIKAIMKLSEGGVFDQIVLRDDIERIKKYYKKRQYVRPAVKSYIYRDGILNLFVHSGNRLAIAFDGNDAISENALLKEMPFFEAEDFNDDLVQEAIQRMLSLYNSHGFPFVQIAPAVTQKEDLFSLTFFVSEGKKVHTGKISFAGVSIDNAKLKSILALQENALFNPDLIESDRETLANFYYALGYISVAVDEFKTTYDENTRTMDIVITIQEGPKTVIESVDVLGIKIVAEDEVRRIIRLTPGDPYNEVDISDARYRLIEYYQTKGFPSAEVNVSRALEEQRARIIFSINEGPFAVFGKTIVTGNQRTKHVVVQRELVKEENAPFDLSILRKEKQKLYSLGLFTDVNVELLESYDERRDVLISLKEGNAGAVEFGFGYSDYERYRGFLDISYRNLWGMHRQGSVRTELSALERRLILQYYEPWFLNSATAFRAFFLTEYREEQNVDTRETRYKLSRNAISSGIERKFSKTLKSEVFYEFSVVNTYDVKPDVVLSREDTGTLVISGVRLGVIYDTRDDPFYPTTGILSGISTKLTAPLFLSESDFIKLNFYGNVYYQLMKRVVIAVSLRGGIAKGYGATDELPIVERFFLGGRATVRGYEQDTLGPKGTDGSPTGGNTFLMGNVEMRFSIGRGVGLVTFLDGGNVWVDTKDLNPLDGKFTAGLGLRYDTPVGPLRVDYGHKLQREKDESRGELHFSIGHAF